MCVPLRQRAGMLPDPEEAEPLSDYRSEPQHAVELDHSTHTQTHTQTHANTTHVTHMLAKPEPTKHIHKYAGIDTHKHMHAHTHKRTHAPCSKIPQRMHKCIHTCTQDTKAHTHTHQQTAFSKTGMTVIQRGMKEGPNRQSGAIHQSQSCCRWHTHILCPLLASGVQTLKIVHSA